MKSPTPRTSPMIVCSVCIFLRFSTICCPERIRQRRKLFTDPQTVFLQALLLYDFKDLFADNATYVISAKCVKVLHSVGEGVSDLFPRDD